MNIPRMPAARLVPAAIAAASLCAATLYAAAPDRPAALKALEQQGVTIVGTFPAPGGLTAWAGYFGQRPVAIYVTPDGKHVIAGTLYDANGKEAADEALEKAVRPVLSDAAWKKLEASRWIADGKPNAARTVYVFTDPNCPYCTKFWADARPWVDSGKVVLRHVMVGILTPTSAGKAAALLADRDPAAALLAYESSHVPANSANLAAGKARPLSGGPLQPLQKIPPEIQRQLGANQKLMASLGLEGTPGIVWRDAKGAVQMRSGVPDGALDAILGAR